MLLVTIINCLPVRNKTIFFSSCKTCLPIICSKNNETNSSLGKEICFVQVSFSAKCVYQTFWQKKVVRMQQIKAMFVFPSKRKGGRKYWVFFFFFNVWLVF